MTSDNDLRQHVLTLLDGKGAHLSFDAVIDAWPSELRHITLDAAPHTAWELLEHVRIAQLDILEFCVKSDYEEPTFPDDYWPSRGSSPDDDAWRSSVERFRRDLEAMKQLVADPAVDLFSEIPHATGQTILREALVVADHNAYHLGQLALLRRLLGAWHDPKLTM